MYFFLTGGHFLFAVLLFFVFFSAVERQPVVLYHANIKQKQQLYAQVISFHQGKKILFWYRQQWLGLVTFITS